VNGGNGAAAALIRENASLREINRKQAEKIHQLTYVIFYHPHNFVSAHPHTTAGPPQFNALSNSTGGNTVGGVCGVRLSCFSFS